MAELKMPSKKKFCVRCNSRWRWGKNIYCRKCFREVTGKK